MFVTRSIDKFFCRISSRGIILVVEGRACDKNTDYFRAIRAGTEVYRSCCTVCHRVKTLPYLSDLNYFLLPFIYAENATRNLTS